VIDMKKILFVASAILALSACAPAVWTKPGADSAQFEQDKAECLYEGNKATATDPNMFAGLMANNLAEQCMKIRGYSQTRESARQTASTSGQQAAKTRDPHKIGATVGMIDANGNLTQSEAQSAGLYVAFVVPSSAANKAGLEPGDIITAFNGKRVKSRQEFGRLIADTASGGVIDLAVTRHSVETHISVTL
jgi:membrane-associated protease RseP (regulator of RpoE activity)